ncbi:MAG TPA: hypothetical protein DCX52_05210 [Massilia sp.]|nr:hypothetical protein [Massilia sp.]
MKNLKIGARLGLGFAIVLALLVALAVTALTRMQSAGDMTDRLVHTSIKNQRNVAEWSKYIEVNSAMIETAFIATDRAVIQDIAERMKAVSARSTQLQQDIENSLRNEGVKAQFAKVKEMRAGYLEARAALLKAKLDGDDTLAAKIHGEQVVPRSAAFLAAMNKLATMQITAADGVATGILDAYQSTRVILLSLSVAALGLGIACAVLITRSITVPIREAVAVAEKVAGGDLTSRVVAHGRDETGQLMRALGSMTTSLAEIVGRVRTGTGAIATASSEIAAGNLDLSSRTEQQAGSLEQTASSMEQLTGAVQQNAEHARHANTLASQAAEVAVRGGEVVQQVVRTMESINASSRKIVDIIGVIDGIAFQTNILALNAAVEAARAGEQGRGFAVVAGEVRNLAQRSAAAAREVKALIDDSVSKVDAGSLLVNDAGATMQEVVASVRQVNSIIGDITAASVAQEAGIGQVNRAIAEMDGVTQKNAALVEEAAAAAESMRQQADRLSEVVGVFKVVAEGGARKLPALA